MTSIKNLLTRSKQLEEEINIIEQLIRGAPGGRLVVRKPEKNKIEYRYSHISNVPGGETIEKYIGKKDAQKAKQIAQRMFFEKKLQDLKKEKLLNIKEL